MSRLTKESMRQMVVEIQKTFNLDETKLNEVVSKYLKIEKKVFASDGAEEFAEQHDMEQYLHHVIPTGKDNTITIADMKKVLAIVNDKKQKMIKFESSAVKLYAEKHKINVLQIQGTGKNGEIKIEDLKRFQKLL